MSENLQPDNTEQDELMDSSETEAAEIGFSDILTGVFSAPKETFRQIAQSELKTTTWLWPVLVLILASVISTFVMMSNADVRSFIKDKARANVEKKMDELVKSGKMTKEQAETTIAQNEKQLEAIGTTLGNVFQSLTILIVTFIFFFIISGYFYFVSQFFLGAEFTYKHAMSVYGPIQYIAAVEVIITLLVTLLLGRPADLSVGGLIGYENKDLIRFILGKLNIFTIWFYFVLSIGLVQLAKSDNAKKYYIMVFGSWIFWGLVWFGITRLVPMFDMYS